MTDRTLGSVAGHDRAQRAPETILGVVQVMIADTNLRYTPMR